MSISFVLFYKFTTVIDEMYWTGPTILIRSVTCITEKDTENCNYFLNKS